MNYSHTQHGPIGWILAVMGVSSLFAALSNLNELMIALPLGIFGVVMVFLALCFGTLTVSDRGDTLAIRFGPLPVFRRHVKYATISEVEPGQTALIDGWGIHYVPGRGWTYNLWGWPCVRLRVNGRTLRIGSDDADNLAGFIQSRITGLGCV